MRFPEARGWKRPIKFARYWLAFAVAEVGHLIVRGARKVDFDGEFRSTFFQPEDRDAGR